MTRLRRNSRLQTISDQQLHSFEEKNVVYEFYSHPIVSHVLSQLEENIKS